MVTQQQQVFRMIRNLMECSAAVLLAMERGYVDEVHAALPEMVDAERDLREAVHVITEKVREREAD